MRKRRREEQAQTAEPPGELAALRDRMLECLRSVTVLDPACGSGNSSMSPCSHCWTWRNRYACTPCCRPAAAFPACIRASLYGIEINPIAHDLASIVVWIGYIQWWRNSGERYHNVPILEPLDNIRQMDAILAFDADGSPVEPAWPSVDVIVSNPPFFATKGCELNWAILLDQLRSLYEESDTRQSDLVCYWFEQSRK